MQAPVNLMNVIPVTQGNCTAKQRQNKSEWLGCGEKRYKKGCFPLQQFALNKFMLYLGHMSSAGNRFY